MWFRTYLKLSTQLIEFRLYKNSTCVSWEDVELIFAHLHVSMCHLNVSMFIIYLQISPQFRIIKSLRVKALNHINRYETEVSTIKGWNKCSRIGTICNYHRLMIETVCINGRGWGCGMSESSAMSSRGPANPTGVPSPPPPSRAWVGHLANWESCIQPTGGLWDSVPNALDRWLDGRLMLPGEGACWVGWALLDPRCGLYMRVIPASAFAFQRRPTIHPWMQMLKTHSGMGGRP